MGIEAFDTKCWRTARPSQVDAKTRTDLAWTSAIRAEISLFHFSIHVIAIPMLPYMVAAASILALLASLYKEQKISPDTQIKRALRIHHLAQGAVIVLALWAAINAAN